MLWSAIAELSEMGVLVDVRDMSEDIVLPSAKATPRLTRQQMRKQQPHLHQQQGNKQQSPSMIGSPAEREYTTQMGSAIAMNALSRLAPATYSASNDTPSAMVTQEISAMSLRMPFATPGMSPITRSMLNSTFMPHQTAPQNRHHNHNSNNPGLFPSTTASRLSLGAGDSLFMDDTIQSHPADAHDSGDLRSFMDGNNHHHNPNFSSSGDGLLAPRGSLFGLPTPSTAMADESMIGEEQDDFLGDLPPPKGGGVARRVSFGPTVGRLSFGGGDVLPPPAASSSMQKAVMTAPTSDFQDNTDHHPAKLQRAAPDDEQSVDHALESSFEMSAQQSNQLQSGGKALFPSTIKKSAGHHDHVLKKENVGEEGNPQPSSSRRHTRSTSSNSNSAGIHLTSSKPNTQQNRQPALPRDSSNDDGEDILQFQQQQLEQQKYVLDVISCFSRALYELAHYRSIEAVEALEQLPRAQFQSGYSCQLLGRASVEINEYSAAIAAFKEMLRCEPYRMQGLELLSSALWHLRKDKELSSLAQQVVEMDRFAPEAWCVLGNACSLQKEHESALRFFQRALQLDPTFTYAHTLCGHEHVATEDMDKAMRCFRAALLCNSRHYNAWYGLGSIHYRQEKYEMAEFHFREARKLHNRSSVLDCYLAMSLNAQGVEYKVDEALDVLAIASRRNESNPTPRFQRAHILMGIDRWEEALEELQIVETLAPKEPPVHAMLGQVYQHLGRIQDSLLHLHIAVDLDPKEANSLKVSFYYNVCKSPYFELYCLLLY